MLMPWHFSDMLVCAWMTNFFSKSMAPTLYCNINNDKEERKFAAFIQMFLAKNVSSIHKVYSFFLKKSQFQIVEEMWVTQLQSGLCSKHSWTPDTDSFSNYHYPAFFPTGSLLPIHLPASHNVLSGWGHVNVDIKTRSMSTPIRRKIRQEIWN